MSFFTNAFAIIYVFNSVAPTGLGMVLRFSLVGFQPHRVVLRPFGATESQPWVLTHGTDVSPRTDISHGISAYIAEDIGFKSDAKIIKYL